MSIIEKPWICTNTILYYPIPNRYVNTALKSVIAQGLVKAQCIGGEGKIIRPLQTYK